MTLIQELRALIERCRSGDFGSTDSAKAAQMHCALQLELILSRAESPEQVARARLRIGSLANRVETERLFARLFPDRSSSEFERSDYPDDFDAIEQALDAAERRGRIAELEDLIERRQVTLDMPTAAALSVRLAQLRAEEKR